MRRLAMVMGAALLSLCLATGSLAASGGDDTIPLPNGFQPEGIDIDGAHFFTGSISTGAVYRGDVRTKEGSILVPGREGRAAIGLKVDDGRVFVAGGPTGQAYVYDAHSGAELATYRLTSAATFINDVVVTPQAAWFTDSFNQVLYKVPLTADGGLSGQGAVRTVPLTGDLQYQEGFNVNGIDATPNGRKLVIVQSNTGMLFTVAPQSGLTTRIVLDHERVRFGDGILLDGRTLYVVQNFQDRVAVVELERGLESGDVVERVRDGDFDIPTTIAERGDRLYLVNARFTTPPTPQTEYWITVIHKPHEKD
ncbi:MAG TPA: superoxide dismutase [Actinomycetota bacterium]|nr:superoxide dismutase [Actinomycetota bacterium]